MLDLLARPYRVGDYSVQEQQGDLPLEELVRELFKLLDKTYSDGVKPNWICCTRLADCKQISELTKQIRKKV